MKGYKMKDNIIKEKSFNFAVRIVNLNKYLVSNKNEYVLSKQILRSGTSIGANVEEAIGGISKSDFSHKISPVTLKVNHDFHTKKFTKTVSNGHTKNCGIKKCFFVIF